MLKERGAAREIAILCNADPAPYYDSYDNWNGGTDLWGLRLELEVGLFSRLSDSERTQAAEIILELARSFFHKFDNHGLVNVRIAPRAVENARWREQAE